MDKNKIDINDVINFIRSNAHCSYSGDCMVLSSCENCDDYVIDYKDLYEWLIGKAREDAEHKYWEECKWL